ncbi:hypothetical protein [Corynebacterium sp. UMB4614]|uniref:hypothetical protein n=1 Tax=Corynebacterium sp. UMB4614 TaxID=3046334 RepID=UPI0025512522|nr:hypothetical protein [Corynebacterium sp. UMB4614]MDK7134536.1 hypothetical protein [Corynebacterium sp. UMB4614]
MKWSEGNEDIAEILAALGRYIDLDQIMLVGARCRDIHQEKYRPGPPARATRDIDFAVALRSWADFDRLKEHFAYPGRAWQAIKVSGFDIDLVPFGAVENPPDEVEREGLILNMAAQLLGSDVAQVLGIREASVLVNRFAEEGDRGIGLAEHLIAEGEHPTPFEARKEQVEALLKGICEAFDG